MPTGWRFGEVSGKVQNHHRKLNQPSFEFVCLCIHAFDSANRRANETKECCEATSNLEFPFSNFQFQSTLIPNPAGGFAASFSKKFGNVFRTQSGFRIFIPGTTSPSIAKHIAILWSS